MEEKTMGSNGKTALPKDAEGREIPLDTRKIFDKEGNEWRVEHVEYDPNDHGWRFLVSKDKYRGFLYARYVYLEKPAARDSWENLLEDLDNAAKGGDNAECLHMRREDIEVGEQCSGCRLYNADDVFSDCSCLAYGDIAARIRKLRSED